MCGRYSLTKFANFLIVLRTEIATIFEPKVVAISARKTITRKFANFVRLYFPHITTHFDQILEFYYFWKVLFGNFVFFPVWICLDKKLYTSFIQVQQWSKSIAHWSQTRARKIYSFIEGKYSIQVIRNYEWTIPAFD